MKKTQMSTQTLRVCVEICVFFVFLTDFICVQISKICVALAAPRKIASLCLSVYLCRFSNYKIFKNLYNPHRTIYTHSGHYQLGFSHKIPRSETSIIKTYGNMMHKIGFLVKKYIVLSTFRLDWSKIRPFRGESASQKNQTNNDCWV